MSWLAEALRPEPSLLVSEWADRYRVLAQGVSSEPGPWRTSRTPYLREIMDCLSSSRPEDFVVFQKGSQIGATEAANNWLGYVIHHAPGYMLYVMPTFDMAKRSSRQKIGPMIEAVPEIAGKVAAPRSRDSGNSMLSKEFPGGAVVITGANSPAGLRSMSARYLYLDEIDGYPTDVGAEGDPINLAMRRTATFRRNRKVFISSTPTVRGFSLIERYFQESDQRRYHVPCLDCGHMQVITWAHIRYTNDDPQTVRFACEACGAMATESAKTLMLEGGEWRPTAKGRYTGFHLSALYSPIGWYSWAEAVADWLEAQKAGAEKLKGFVNTVLGETWEETGDTVDPNGLLARREDYSGKPDGVLVVTIGADVQKDRIEFEVVGWGEGEESWSIDYVIVPGDTARPEVWADLAEAVQPYGAKLVLVDSGYNTSMVYEWCRRRRWAVASKGIAGPGHPLIEDRKKRLQRMRKTNKTQYTPEPIGVDQAKALVYSRLRLSKPGPGYCHFPANATYDVEYFEQLTAEMLVSKMVKGRRVLEWVARRPRNEGLDCRVLALAALHLSGVKLQKPSESVQKPKEPDNKNQEPPRNFVTSWK